jgi:cell wall-associated NlpC family hydrolase
MSRLALALSACAVALALPFAAPAAAGKSWADRDIRFVAAHGLMGGNAAAFRPDDVLTARQLADLVAGLSGKPTTPSADPDSPATIAQLDAALVRGLALAKASRKFTTGARAAGLAPPSRFGTEVVARLLGFRTDHRTDALEPAPNDPATRAEAAFSAAKILRWKGWEAQYAADLADTFAPPPVSGWQQKILHQAVSLIGYPYVWGGTSEHEQEPLGTPVPGGFDCSGLVWRVYKLAGYAVGTDLAATVRGRTTYAMSREVPRASRIAFADLQPADVLFFGARGSQSKPAQVDHAGIYLGSGWMIHASGTGVSLAPLTGTYRTRFAWGRRPLAEAGLA